MFFYTDAGSKSSFDPDLVNRLNPNTMYIKHLENLYVLKFIELKSDKFFEKAQATKEIKICEKKLKFWERKITNQDLINDKIKQLKTQWNT
jgi:hypothetical protein